MAAFSREEVLAYHKGGKVGVRLPKALKTKEDLCLAYTPGVAQAVKAIAERPASVYDCTAKPNLVAVVSDGTAILGLGDLEAVAHHDLPYLRRERGGEHLASVPAADRGDHTAVVEV